MSLRWYIRLFTVQTSEKVCLHVFKFSVHRSFTYALVSNSQTSENVWDLAQAAPPTETDVCCLTYTHVCSIRRFLLTVQLRSQCLPFYRFRAWTHGKRCNSLVSPKCILFLPYLLLYLAISLSNWESPCMFIAKLISERKHPNGCFPMWCQFSSIQVYVVNLLNSREHM